MTRNKNTKRALLASIMSLVLCFAMLIGTTFAWFTDTASTGVNKIQAGNLKIKLQKKVGDSWADVGGEKLDFIASDNRENILWEPGATYVLPALKITNEGNLWLKYKVEVSGVDKTDAKLLEAIDFYVAEEELGTTNRPDLTKLTKLEDYFKYDETTPKTLAPQKKAADGKVENETESTKVFTIVGHMREDAGNEYNQKDANGNGLSVEGIAISVFATQYTQEKDSFDDQYDKNAGYPVSQSASDWSTLQSILNDKNNEGAPIEITLEKDIPVSGTLKVDGNVTLNVANNRLLTSNGYAYTNVTVNSGAKLVVNATKPDGWNKTAGAFVVNEGANLTINGGSYYANAMGQSNITANKNSTVNIKDGSYDANGAAGTVVLANNGSVVNITGGSLGASAAGCTIMKADGSKIVMTGGKFGYVNTNSLNDSSTSPATEIKARYFSALNGGEIFIAKSVMPDKPKDSYVAEGCSVSEAQVDGVDCWLIK